uniref:Uncharacterized protein n=3 Tax=Hemiselmis andersenii TaxID=464988 RepID=A0A6T8HXT6_HEMAN|mmetsp:Transcript_1580/g.3779  ORF Transcript_1580/g.3779 Transcript_1580/m.3779 type:complete len:813 (+) Transcript_1580:131-2569(+)
MLGSWTTIVSKPDAASTKAKLAKYRSRITTARNQLNHSVIPEQIKKYAKWEPNTCYAQLVQAECLLASGDAEGANKHLDAGLGLELYSSIDQTEVLMWKAVLAYVDGDSQHSLKWCNDLPEDWLEQCLELGPLETVGKDAQQHASVIRRRLLSMSPLGSDASMPEYSPDIPSYRSRLVHILLCCKACALEAEGDSNGACEAYEQLILFSRRSSKDGASPIDALSAPLVERALMYQCTRSLAIGDTALAIAALRRGLSSSFTLPPASRQRGRALLSSLLMHCCACRASEYETALLNNELQPFNFHSEHMLSQQPRVLEEACAVLMLEDEDIALGDSVAVLDNGGGFSWPCDDLACFGGTRTTYSAMAQRYRRSSLLQSSAANSTDDGSSVLRGALAAVAAGAPEEALSLIQVWLKGQGPCSWNAAEDGGTTKAQRKASHNTHVATLLAAKLCCNQLDRPELGLEYARRAMEDRASARAHHSVAVGLLQCALVGCDVRERKEMYSEALNNLETTILMEPADHLARLHLSLVLALSGMLHAARQVLDADALSDDPLPLSLGLSAILCAALGDEEEALGRADVMRDRFPNDIWSMRLHAALQLEYGNPHLALETYFEIVADASTKTAFLSPTLELGPWPRCLLERPKLNLDCSWDKGASIRGDGQLAVFEAWIDIVRAYRKGGMYQHASTAVAMARQVVAVHADVEYENGKISEACGHLEDAASSFTTALAIDPHHTASLIALASLRVSTEPDTAVQLVRRALRRDCTNADTWRLLCRSHHACGEEEQAREALLLSMELDSMTMPVPLSFVPVFLQ